VEELPSFTFSGLEFLWPGRIFEQAAVYPSKEIDRTLFSSKSNYRLSRFEKHVLRSVVQYATIEVVCLSGDTGW
jgi:hypothetical protein